MRKLTNEDNQAYIDRSKKAHDQINDELLDLGNRIEDNKKAIDAANNRIDELVDSDTISKENGLFEQTTTDNLNVNNKAIIGDLEVDNNITANGDITANAITADDANLANIESTNIKAADIETGKLSANVIENKLLETESITTETITADTGKFNTLDINNAIIENFDVAHVISEDVKTQAIETETINSKQAVLSDLASEIIRSDVARLDVLQSHNLIFEDNPDNPYYIHIEPQDQPSATDYRILEVPFFDTGDYVLSLHDPNTDMGWWSVIIRNNQSNLTVSYSRRTMDLEGEPLSNPTLSQFYIYDFDGQSPRLYIKTYVGGNLYWQNQSLRERPEITMYNEYPFDISLAGALKYDVLHTAATWFTRHVDIGANQSLGNASLFLIPSDWNNATKEQLEYNTERDIPYRYYLPDQSLDTTDEVSFANIVITPLDGRWVYNVENAIKGHDPVRIKEGDDGKQEYDENNKPLPVIGDKEAGQLNSYPWVIETEDLARFNGKVGTQDDTVTTVAGTIYRDDAYQQINTHLYRRIDFDDYDKVDYDSKTTIDNRLVVQRKHDSDRGKKYDLCVSDPAVKSQYEDPDLQVWDQFTYVFSGEYPTGTMFVKWIERTMPNGTVSSRVLESTIDSDEYITKVIQFKEDFSYGSINLHKYSYDNYHKPLKYLGDVVEGRWNAGELHSIKKNVDPLSSDYTGVDYDYTGAITADGKTKLRDNVAIINDYDSSDVKPVDAYERTVNSVTDVIVKEVNTHIGKDDELADVNITVAANTKISNRGPIDVNNVGDITFETDGNIDSKINGNITEQYLGKKVSRGPSQAAVHELEDDPFAIADWNNTVIENTEIGTTEEKRDLRVHGNIYVEGGEIIGGGGSTIDVEENRLLYYQDKNFTPMTASFAGPKSRWATKDVADGSFVYLPDWNGTDPLADPYDYLNKFNPNNQDAALRVTFDNYSDGLEFEINNRIISVSGTSKYYDHGAAWDDGYYLPLSLNKTNFRYAAIVSRDESKAHILDLLQDNILVRQLEYDGNYLTTNLKIKFAGSLPEGIKHNDDVDAETYKTITGVVIGFDISQLVAVE